MTQWQLRLLRTAQKYLDRMPEQDRDRVNRALRSLLSNPQSLGIKRLKGRPESRLRVGDYRVILRVDRENKLFIVIRIGPRGDVYK